jgi:hypothetical protein
MYGIGTSNRTNPRPTWWKLYASVAPAPGLFVLVEIVAPPGAVRTVLQTIAVLILVATMTLWVRLNRVALELQGRRDGGWREVRIDATGFVGSADMRSGAHDHDGPSMRVMTDSERSHRQKRGRDERIRFAIRG